MSSDKNASRAPVNIAPIILVAANATPKSIIENKIAPKIPISRVDSIGQRQPILTSGPSKVAVTTSNTARYTTAMPSTTHKKAGVMVITALI
jgi:hypothetical protein